MAAAIHAAGAGPCAEPSAPGRVPVHPLPLHPQAGEHPRCVARSGSSVPVGGGGRGAHTRPIPDRDLRCPPVHLPSPHARRRFTRTAGVGPRREREVTRWSSTGTARVPVNPTTIRRASRLSLSRLSLSSPLSSTSSRSVAAARAESWIGGCIHAKQSVWSTVDGSTTHHGRE
jgi:hypothetical protein